MMKYITGILLIVILLTACQKEISDLQSQYFIKFYGNYMEDDGYDIQPAGDGGYVIVGSSGTKDDGRDIILIRVDKFGNQLPWSPKYYGGAGDDAAYSVRVLDDGGYIIAGYVTETTGRINKNAVLIRTGSQGNLIWQREFGGPSDDEARSVISKETGGYIFAGYTESITGQKQIYLVNVDVEGSVVSTTTRPISGEVLTSIIRLSDGNFLVAGTKNSATGSVDNPNSQILILVLNEVGNDLDNYSFGDPGVSETVSSIFPSSNGTFFLVGTAESPGSGHKDIMIKKLSRRKIIWEKTITGNESLEGKAIFEMSDSTLALIANKSYSENNRNIALYFLNSRGDINASREFGASENQTAEALDFHDGQIVILGKNSVSYTMNGTSAVSSMITLIKTDREGNLWR